jgi:hypothetical protein
MIDGTIQQRMKAEGEVDERQRNRRVLTLMMSFGAGHRPLAIYAASKNPRPTYVALN